MLKAVRRTLLIALLVVGGSYLLYQGFLFWRAMDKFPPSTQVAGVPVGGLTWDQAYQAISDAYLGPVAIYSGEEKAAELSPLEAGLAVDIDAMLTEARDAWQNQEMWRRYAEFVIGISPRPIDIPLKAVHNEEALRANLNTIADFVDRPARSPQLLVELGRIEEGEAGVLVDRTASLHALRSTLYTPDNRVTQLTLVEDPAPEWGIEALEESIQNILASFDGFASVFIMDLATGEEVRINSDVAVSGLSILKIPIFVEAYRALDEPPDAFEEDLFVNTATASSNHSANLLLHVIAGEDNTYEGAEQLTEAMREMGLVNTFMAIPYDATTVPTRPGTYATPANQRTDIDTLPDPTMQTTAEEIGTLLAMLYYCAEGEGGLLAVYPEQITQDECRAIVDLMVENVEGNLIRFGVPDDPAVRVSHKHGWSFNEHGDAGIVYSPGGDYVIYTLVAQPESDWLDSEVSFPVLRTISRATYNYFNHENPFLGREQEGALGIGGR